MRQPKINNKTSFRKWHRWIGYSSLILFVILSITGIILNRTEQLNLNQVTIKNRIITSLYGLSPTEPILHFQTRQNWVSWVGGRLYLNGDFVAANRPKPVGVITINDMIIIGNLNSLSLYLEDGSLVEVIDSASLPGALTIMGKSREGHLIIETSRNKYETDDNFLSFAGTADEVTYAPSLPKDAPDNTTEKILEDFRGQGVSLYRLTLDLHSGRLFGSWGPYLMDLAAICLIFLSISSLILRKRNGKAKK